MVETKQAQAAAMVQGDSSQRRYLLSRLAAMFEMHKQRILTSKEETITRYQREEREAVEKKTASQRRLYEKIRRVAGFLQEDLTLYKKATGVDLWPHSSNPLQSLRQPYGQLTDRYHLIERANQHNQKRFRELQALYQDAKGQILFKPKAVALDYIEGVEWKAARI